MTVKRACCFFSCHDQRGCYISDYKVLLNRAVSKTILGDFHSWTHLCRTQHRARIFAAKMAVETKLRVPISRTVFFTPT